MNAPTLEQVLLLHQLLAEETGGASEIRDIGLLESALESAFQTFGGKELYPTKEEKGARLGFALISNHAFMDGNKRIGMFVLLSFMEANGLPLHCTSLEVETTGFAVASGDMDYASLLNWVRQHT